MTYSNEAVVEEFCDYGTNEKIQARHLYFEEDVLFSYGSHFPLCIRLKDGWIINSDGYSMTTSRHKSDVIIKLTNKDFYGFKAFEKIYKDGILNLKDDYGIKLMNTREMKDLINELPQDKPLRFIKMEEIAKLKILRGLKNAVV